MDLGEQMYANHVVFAVEGFGVISETLVFTSGEIMVSRRVINFPRKNQRSNFRPGTKYITFI